MVLSTPTILVGHSLASETYYSFPLPKLGRPKTGSRHLKYEGRGGSRQFAGHNVADIFLCANALGSELHIVGHLDSMFAQKISTVFWLPSFSIQPIWNPGRITRSCWYHPVPAASGIPISHINPKEIGDSGAGSVLKEI